MKIKIWKEWYDIIVKISLTRKKNFEETVKEILGTNECLNLNKINTSKLKEINIKIDDEKVSAKEVQDKIKKFLFCE